MAIVVVGGSGKDVGKTSLVCAVIAALPEFAWTAVKVTAHEYEPTASAEGKQAVWEEAQAGQETDTGRYLAAGARRALLVRRCGAEAPIQEIRRLIGEDRNVIFESNRLVELVKPDVCLALIGDGTERKESFSELLQAADAVVCVGETAENVPAGLRRFRLPSAERLPDEMVQWLREKLGRWKDNRNFLR